MSYLKKQKDIKIEMATEELLLPLKLSSLDEELKTANKELLAAISLCNLFPASKNMRKELLENLNKTQSLMNQKKYLARLWSLVQLSKEEREPETLNCFA